MMCDIAQARCERQADEIILIASDSESVIEIESSEDDWAGAAVWISSSTGDEADADFGVALRPINGEQASIPPRRVNTTQDESAALGAAGSGIGRRSAKRTTKPIGPQVRRRAVRE